MPPPSKVMQLPEPIRDELNARLIAAGFAGYEGLVAWLEERGHEISVSALHRYGQAFGKRLAALKVATEQARAIAEATGDDEGRLGDALTSLVQQKAFEVLVEMDDVGDVDLVSLGTMLSRLNKTAVTQKQWIAQVREKAQRAADEAAAIAREGGLSDEAAEQIRAKILGVAA